MFRTELGCRALRLEVSEVVLSSQGCLHKQTSDTSTTKTATRHKSFALKIAPHDYSPALRNRMHGMYSASWVKKSLSITEDQQTVVNIVLIPIHPCMPRI